MYCKECGKVLDQDSKYCSYCGTKQFLNRSTGDQSDLYPTEDSDTKNINVTLSLGRPKFVAEKKYGDTPGKIVKDEKYDLTYRKETDARDVGILLGIVLGIGTALAGFDGDWYLSLSILYILFSIISIIWVVRIAKRQNRNKVGWGFLAFFSPCLALIIIGSLKKLRQPT